MFDTHCHLNFKVFENRENEVVKKAERAGVDYLLIPGTDFQTSKKAVEIACKFENVFAAAGIHPHHAMALKDIDTDIKKIEELLTNKKVIAIGEVGIDKHGYQKTKYNDYKIDINFIEKQKKLLQAQIELALKYEKSLIFHNWEAKEEFLQIVNNNWSEKIRGRAVFHCCEPDEELLTYALDHNIYIGVDGDITYNHQKQEFIKKVPLDFLVLETDSPYLTPEPLRQTKKFPNEPANIPLILDCISKIKTVALEDIDRKTTENGKKLFNIK